MVSLVSLVNKLHANCLFHTSLLLIYYAVLATTCPSKTALYNLQLFRSLSYESKSGEISKLDGEIALSISQISNPAPTSDTKNKTDLSSIQDKLQTGNRHGSHKIRVLICNINTPLVGTPLLYSSFQFRRDHYPCFKARHKINQSTNTCICNINHLAAYKTSIINITQGHNYVTQVNPFGDKIKQKTPNILCIL